MHLALLLAHSTHTQEMRAVDFMIISILQGGHQHLQYIPSVHLVLYPI